MKNIIKFLGLSVLLVAFSIACSSEEEDMASNPESMDSETVELSSHTPETTDKVDVPAEVSKAVHDTKESFKKSKKMAAVDMTDGNFFYHEVKRGEWLGKILREKDLKPIWGAGNYAETIVKLNPDAFDKDGNLNHGAKIKIPAHLSK
ncbi:MAG: hypothetical protein SGJ18_03620 [Pseudomonadota bacterium]|nr:hypothetical protein [Pseudomonadota bacterium]